ncbi:MAG: hypothetical protein ACRD6X_07845 [Pyrinomonadaceae bacterium]
MSERTATGCFFLAITWNVEVMAARRLRCVANRMPSVSQPRRVRATPENAFFSDDEFEQNKTAIDSAFVEITNAITDAIRVIVVPADGLGTGRAQLEKRAPRTFAFLQQKLAELASSGG